MQSRLKDFDEAGIRVAAISVDPPDDSRALAEAKGYSFRLLSDPDMKVIAQYDLVDPIDTVARPAEFLVDATGMVRWRNLTSSVYIRATPDQVLASAKTFK
jgi:mycoredoxin-dependent peroxiredoxin